MKRMFKSLLVTIVIVLFSSVSFAASIGVTWNANSETDLAGYNIYDKVGTGTNAKVGTTGVSSNPTFTIPSVVDGVHTVTVTAFDSSGNESLPSDPESITVDTVAPGIPSKPATTVTGNIVKLTWTAVTATDLAGYGIYDNGILIGSIGVMASPTFTTAALADGSHSFTIDSVDNSLLANRSAKSTATVVVIDTTAPIKPSKPTITLSK